MTVAGPSKLKQLGSFLISEAGRPVDGTMDSGENREIQKAPGSLIKASGYLLAVA